MKPPCPGIPRDIQRSQSFPSADALTGETWKTVLKTHHGTLVSAKHGSRGRGVLEERRSSRRGFNEMTCALSVGKRNDQRNQLSYKRFSNRLGAELR